MMKRRARLLICGLALFATVAMLAPREANAQFKPLLIPFEKDSLGKPLRWMRFIMYGQFQMNVPIAGNAQVGNIDMSIRRLRFLTLFKPTSHDFVFFHFGINNQKLVSGGVGDATGPAKKPQLYIHDFTYDRLIFKGGGSSLFLGLGLNYWNGISRASSASGLNLDVMDLSFVAYPFIEGPDQFARKLGIYAKGNLDLMNYSLVLNFPFAPGPGTSNPPKESDAEDAKYLSDISVFNDQPFGKIIEGYFAFQFLDRESTTLNYSVGTYLGKKKVFNVGVGFFAFPDGVYQYNDAQPEQQKQVNAAFGFSADVYADLPIGEKASSGVFTGYGAYYFYDFGKNYYRRVGDAALIATGSSFIAKATYTLPPSVPVRLGLYGQFTMTIPQKDKVGKDKFGNDLTYEKENWIQYEVGLNWFAIAHNVRFTVAYRNTTQGEKKHGDRVFAQVTIWM